ncbi:MAG: ssDNA-binding domain-containing protein [Clostridia bacterium]|nr:ssDNA-binding domain-containing protein [Clostridia bacterium]
MSRIVNRRKYRKDVRGFQRLTPERQDLVSMVLDNLNSGLGLWHRNWTSGCAPVSTATGESYRGTNNLYLSLVAMAKGYEDNRWVTYKQITDNGWHFKIGSGGGTLGKGNNVTIVFFDKKEKKDKKDKFGESVLESKTAEEEFGESVLENKTAEEKDEYVRKNIHFVRKVYNVYNADLVEGMPPRRNPFANEGRNERVEALLEYWSKNQAKIVYGGDEAFYLKARNEIHLPPREDFKSYPEFYTTVLHEIAHSTAHPGRLDRPFYAYGSDEYSMEELRAEISALFLCQEYGVALTERNVKNESAYVRNWIQSIKSDPNALFKAIADADRISRFVFAKEYEAGLYKNPDDEFSFAADAAEDLSRREQPEYTEIFTVTVAGDEKPAAEKKSELEELISRPEVFVDTTRTGSKGRYIPPSQVVSDKRHALKAVDPLTSMSDIHVFECAAHTRSGERFLALYNGRDLMRNMDKSRATLFSRLAVFSHDEEQLIRIVKSSAMYDSNLPESYYTDMARKAVKDMKNLCKEGVQSSMARSPAESMYLPGEDKAG